MANNIAETLSNAAGWLTVLDGPLHGISGTAAALVIIGYVKTHHRRMLAREHWIRVPELAAGGTVGPLHDGGRALRLPPARGWPRAVAAADAKLGSHPAACGPR